jgi:hypothetical protein
MKTEENGVEPLGDLVEMRLEDDELGIRRPGFASPPDVAEESYERGAGGERLLEDRRDPGQHLPSGSERPGKNETLLDDEGLDIDAPVLEHGEDGRGFLLVTDHDAVIRASQPDLHEADGLLEVALVAPEVGNMRVDGNAPARDPEVDRRTILRTLAALVFHPYGGPLVPDPDSGIGRVAAESRPKWRIAA